MADDQPRLRRCHPFAGQDFSISAHQLVAIGQPHQSIREMLAASDAADSRRRPANGLGG